jgi:hypothetical protein
VKSFSKRVIQGTQEFASSFALSLVKQLVKYMLQTTFGEDGLSKVQTYSGFHDSKMVKL